MPRARCRATGSARRRYTERASRSKPVKARTDAEWLDALKSSGDAQSVALEELRAYLLRAATYSLPGTAATCRT